MNSSGYRHQSRALTIPASLGDIDLKVEALARGPRTSSNTSGALYATESTGLTVTTLDMDTLDRARTYHLDRWFQDSGDKDNARTPTFRVTITPAGEAAQTWDVNMRECGQVWLHLITTARTSAGVGTLTLVAEGVTG